MARTRTSNRKSIRASSHQSRNKSDSSTSPPSQTVAQRAASLRAKEALQIASGLSAADIRAHRQVVCSQCTKKNDARGCTYERPNIGPNGLRCDFCAAHHRACSNLNSLALVEPERQVIVPAPPPSSPPQPPVDNQPHATDPKQPADIATGIARPPANPAPALPPPHVLNARAQIDQNAVPGSSAADDAQQGELDSRRDVLTSDPNDLDEWFEVARIMRMIRPKML